MAGRSNPRAGAWARRKARSRQRAFVRANPIALGLLVVAGVSIAATYQVFFRGWAAGALFGGAVVASVAAAVHVVTLASGSAATSMGAQGEEWTALELRKLERGGARIFNNIHFYDGDIDHALIGNGCVLAIETKWSGKGWTLRTGGDRFAAHAVDVARRRANRLSSLLHSRTVGATVDVVPVLILWGGCDSGPRVIDGVNVMAGGDFCAWFRNRTEREDPAVLEHVVAGLESFTARQHAYCSDGAGRHPAARNSS